MSACRTKPANAACPSPSFLSVPSQIHISFSFFEWRAFIVVTKMPDPLLRQRVTLGSLQLDRALPDASAGITEGAAALAIADAI